MEEQGREEIGRGGWSMCEGEVGGSRRRGEREERERWGGGMGGEGLGGGGKGGG